MALLQSYIIKVLYYDIIVLYYSISIGMSVLIEVELCIYIIEDNVAEWLRRLPAKQFPFGSVGSNPAVVVFL